MGRLPARGGVILAANDRTSCPTPFMADFIVTIDVYVFDVESKTDAIDRAIGAVEQGGLSGDVLDTFKADRDPEPSKRRGTPQPQAH